MPVLLYFSRTIVIIYMEENLKKNLTEEVKQIDNNLKAIKGLTILLNKKKESASQLSYEFLVGLKKINIEIR